MANVAFAWQLGAGRGHVYQMLPIAAELVRRGHTVYGIFRDLARAAAVFRGTGLRLLQAPMHSGQRVQKVPQPVGFAEFLTNIGFGDGQELFALAAAWRNTFGTIRPDLVMFDHSPVALLASRAVVAKRVLIGSGFCNPPDISPLPMIRPAASSADRARAIMQEERVLQRVNAILSRWGEGTLARLGQLYGDVDECVLATFAELDHFIERAPDARYWGPVNADNRAPPRWPDGNCGCRVFAYLKRSPALPFVLAVLKERRWPTLVFGDGIDRQTKARYACGTLAFVEEPVDMGRAARECDLAVLNATHGTTCDVLLAGKPILLLPLYAEQRLLADRVLQLGAGEMLSGVIQEREPIEEAFDRMGAHERYAYAARAFAVRHASFDPAIQRHAMVERICELIPRRGGATVVVEKMRRNFLESSRGKAARTQTRTAPTVYFVCPEFTTAAGGVRIIYRHVDLLNQNGISAFVLHATPGFRVKWFANDTRIAYAPQTFGDEDVVVFPEVEGPFIEHTAPGSRKVVFNQNAYYTFRRFGLAENAPTPPYLLPDVLATITVSEDTRSYLEYTFHGIRVHRVQLGIDPELYHPNGQKQRQVSLMPRKNANDVEQVVNILRVRGALRGFDVAVIDGLSQQSAAKVMRESMVFLSFGHPEGCPLPPLEAMACGCVTVGYHGNGGREYFTPDHGFPIDVGDIIGYAKTVERILATLDENPQAYDEITCRAASFVRDTYSPENERADVIACWREILGSVKATTAMGPTMSDIDGSLRLNTTHAAGSS